MDKMMYHYIDNVVMQLFYNDSKMAINNLIWSINEYNELQHVRNWFWLISYI
jgi:hypothetical protein